MISGPGIVIANFGGSIEVEDEHGDIHRCVAKKNINNLVCGDRVEWGPVDNNSGRIHKVLPRNSLLSRPDPNGRVKPVAANIDQIVIVTASKPGINEGLIDRYLIASELTGIKPVILLNKIDLLDNTALAETKQRLSVYERIGYTLLYASTRREHGLDLLMQNLVNKTNVLVGESGVGKSSLVNSLIPEINAQTSALSESTGTGKHTTSASRLYHIPESGQLIDSPGVREFGLWNITTEQAAQGYIEFHDYLGKCKFNDCRHTVEPGCAIKEAVEQGTINKERFERYQQIIESLNSK